MNTRWVLMASAFAPLSACAPSPRVFHYPDTAAWTLIVASPNEVAAICNENPPATEDDGSERRRTKRPAACWKPGTRTAWVSWTHPHATMHENCHAAGLPREICAAYVWE